MPAVSKNQRKAMGMARAIQQGKMAPNPGTPSAEIAKSMKPGDVEDFASTKEKGLPKTKTRRFGAKKDHRPQKGVRGPGMDNPMMME